MQERPYYVESFSKSPDKKFCPKTKAIHIFKYSNCVVNAFVPIEFSYSSEASERHSLSESPLYVLYFLHKDFDKQFIHQKMDKPLNCSSATVKFVIDVKKDFKICQNFNFDNKPVSKLVNEKKWLSRGQANMNRIHILSDIPFNMKTIHPKSCHLYTDRLLHWNPPLVEHCVLIVLGKKHNFTFGGNDISTLPPGTLRRGIFERRILQASNLDSFSSKNRRQVIEYAFVQESWAHMVVLERLEHHNQAITEVFDVPLWLYLFILHIVLRLSNSISVYAVENNFKVSVSKFLGLMISRELNKKLKSYSQSWKHIYFHKVNKLVWSLGITTIVSFAYKGNLVSCLTREPEPQYAKTFEDVVMSGMTIRTFYVEKLTNGSSKPFLPTDIQQKLQNCKVRHLGDRKFLLNINKSLIYSGSVDNFTIDMFEAQYIQQKSNGANNYFQKEFAVADPLKNIRALRRLLTELIPSLWISPIVGSDSFRTVRPFVVDPDYYPIFKDGLARLQESGMFYKWGLYYEDRMQAQQQKQIERIITTKHNVSGTYFSTVLLSKHKLGPWNMQELRIIWIVYTIAFLLIILVFVLEITIHKFHGQRKSACNLPR